MVEIENYFCSFQSQPLKENYISCNTKSMAWDLNPDTHIPLNAI